MELAHILKECKKNNPKAQAALYKMFAPKLYAVAFKYSPNKQEAEDNLHDGFLTILKKIDQFKNKGSFEGWMKRIVTNTVLQKYRKTTIFPLISEEIQEEVTLDIDEENIDLNLLLHTIQQLPNRYRLVFNLYVLDGYSHKEIASLLGISEGTSKSNLSRAKAILKTRLENNEQLNLNNF